MTNWNEEIDNDQSFSTENPGPLGYVLIALIIIVAPVSAVLIIYMLAQYSEAAAAGLALILLASLAWGLSGWQDG